MEESPRKSEPTRRTVAFFPGVEHLAPCVAVIEALVVGGLRVVAFGEQRAQAEVEAAGAEFVDIYDGATARDYDACRPIGLNYVTFAAERGEAVIRCVEPHSPFVVVREAFAVVGLVVAAALKIPHVNLASSHNRHAGDVEDIWRRADLHITSRSTSAVAQLRERYGIADTSPFLYRPRASPHLNLYPEPPEWLPPEQRAPFEPVRFIGSLPSGLVDRVISSASLYSEDATLRVYAAFGGQVRWGRRPEAQAAFSAVIDAIESRPGAELLIGLGGRHDELERRAGGRVRVETHADQWRALAEADVFVTHHGLKSTHEGCFHRVPMISYPLQYDQPDLARRSQELNLAVPLVPELLGRVTAEDVVAAIERVGDDSDVLRPALAQARRWEEDVVARRAAIAAEIAAL
jgi:UDP:flavonoid glycosyltransferase YjiC (YdhE family)